ncbi:hypothetical protein QF039_003765 [Pseudomonas sp. W2I6]|nr:hypothetical protein [Pseudomonas sp. W2I6]
MEVHSMNVLRPLRQAIALATLLSAGQSVLVTYTDTLEISTAHEG